MRAWPAAIGTFAAVLCTAACHGAALREPAPFVCRGQQPPDPPGLPGQELPGTSLELKLLAPGERPTLVHLRSTDWDQLAPLRLSINARMVPLGVLAVSLGEALQANVLVDRRLVDVRVSLTLPDVSVAELIGILETTYPVRSTYAWGTLAFESEFTIQQRALRGAELEPTDTQVIATVDASQTDQLASLFCAQFASPRGTATVVGDSVIVSDSGDRVRAFERFLREHRPW